MKPPPLTDPTDPRLTARVRERFWAHVVKAAPDDCWRWIGATLGVDGTGYGQCRLDDMTRVYAHRLAVLLDGRSFTPEAPWALHSCDNPTCCNPAHLRPGSKRANARDMVERGRALTGERAPFRRHPESCPRGEAHCRAKLTERQAQNIRKRFSAGGVTMAELARKYRMSYTAIRRIVRGLTWKHLTMN